VGVDRRRDPVSGGEAAVFLDRDGVINELVPDPVTGVPESPYRADDVRLMPGAAIALEELHDAGLTLVVTSNQPAAAKGIASAADLDAVHERVVELLGDAAGAVEDWRYCRHHPDAGDPAQRDCDCRKPKPGMIIDAARELGLDLERSWTVGDADRDIEAGRAAGTRTVLVENPDSPHRRAGAAGEDLRAADLPSAARAILGQ
jgi:D-glycero-D-manno-heptose 1,7-bisphosphate phosphatase